MIPVLYFYHTSYHPADYSAAFPVSLAGFLFGVRFAGRGSFDKSAALFLSKGSKSSDCPGGSPFACQTGEPSALVVPSLGRSKILTSRFSPFLLFTFCWSLFWADLEWSSLPCGRSDWGSAFFCWSLTICFLLPRCRVVFGRTGHQKSTFVRLFLQAREQTGIILGCSWWRQWCWWGERVLSVMIDSLF